ncbi:helix-turn-helix transcriptional regulator [Aromatoleum anaerobium]|uniref:WYL domain-containing protein n=1 Tax=Aromatoleum anaerobium TaxID=182180 RepID=A0ABX1PNF3_9RHOO|nr:WYL domain-containing protein [Aromatoleum anaerobium]MCK0508562.1 WYL domain-containing protein [Aromatoleum anaerobium]
MDRTERLYRIDRLLNERGVVPLRMFLDDLEISLPTFKRDLEYLRERLNAPIVWDREARGYRFDVASTGPRYELPALWFNASEVYALLTMQQLLKNLEPGLLAPHVEPLLSRLRMLLDRGDISPAEVEKRIRFHRQAARAHDTKHFAPIAAAVLQRRRIVVQHHNRARNESLQREVSPQRLTFYRETWYLDAWCHLRDELRSFALDAIKDVKLSTNPAHEVPDEDIRQTLDAGYDIFSGKGVQWAELEFTPERARWVSRETWHPLQEGRFAEDGTYRLRVPFSNPTELMMDILRHVPAVKVLAPISLRDGILGQLQEALRSA